MYAVVAPNFSSVYSNWAEVERIKALYPYPKWCKCATEKEAHEFIRRNSYGHLIREINKYGDTFENLYVDAKYRIGEDCLYYVFDVSRVGNMRIVNDDCLIEYKGSKIFVKYPGIYISEESIGGHMSAIHNLLTILGDFVDVNITLPNYSIFYALTMYSRDNSRVIRVVKDKIARRACAVSYSMQLRGLSYEE